MHSLLSLQLSWFHNHKLSVSSLSIQLNYLSLSVYWSYYHLKRNKNDKKTFLIFIFNEWVGSVEGDADKRWRKGRFLFDVFIKKLYCPSILVRIPYYFKLFLRNFAALLKLLNSKSISIKKMVYFLHLIFDVFSQWLS